MRPKKRILLIDTDEDRRGEFKFVLTVCGYNVIQHARGQIDLILVRWPIAAESCKRLKANHDCPLVLMLAKADIRIPVVAGVDAVLTGSTSRLELLERIKVMTTAHKRGPKPARKLPQTATPEPAATAATA